MNCDQAHSDPPCTVPVVPQSCDRDDPAVVVISRMQYMDMFNNIIMNKSMAKGVNE